MNKTTQIFILCMVCIPMLGQAKNAATQYFQTGNTHYEAGEFLEAKEAYETALNQGIQHPDLLYNYANSLFRLEKLGPAILHYEKALLLAPQDTDIQASLKYARSQTVDKHPEPAHNLFTRILWKWHMSYSLNTAFWLLLIGLGSSLLIGSSTSFLKSSQKKQATLLNRIAIVLAIVTLLPLPSLILRVQTNHSNPFAIVLESSLTIYSGPGNSYEELAKVHEGTKFEILSILNGWAKVKLANGKGGYVLETSLGTI